MTATFYLLKYGAILPFKAHHVFLFSESVEHSFILLDQILQNKVWQVPPLLLGDLMTSKHS